MQAFPFHAYRFSVLSVERPAAALQQLLEDHGYVYLCDHGAFGDQMWVDQHATEAGAAASAASGGAAAAAAAPGRPTARRPKARLDLAAVQVEVGPAVPRFSDGAASATDPRGKRCDLGLYTGLYGTQPKRAGRAAGLAAGHRRS